MRIRNLEINILYTLCDPGTAHRPAGTVPGAELFQAFADIPREALLSTLNGMVAQGLVEHGPSPSQLSVTPLGVRRLRSSFACRVRRLDPCDCGRSR